MRSISNANSNVAAACPSQKSATVQVCLQHIRNATVKLKYAGVTFLIDPMLAEKGRYPGLPGTYQSHIRNPTVDLPLPASEIIDDVDAVILTHAHPDHWDETAEALIPRDIRVFVQNQLDAKTIRSQNFENVTILADKEDFRGVSIYRTEGIHGSKDLYSMSGIGEILGEVMGVVLKSYGQQTVYIAGDTVWGSEVQEALQLFKPEITVLNAGHAVLEGLDDHPILMGKEAVKQVALAAPSTRIVAVHLEAINHCTLSRTELRSYLDDHGIGDRVLIPEDGGLLML
ncbi:MAG: MBL fold metallo-hydrolase [Marinobacter adhaerens]|uniref:MBL fold metallo-hydrolase n=1 Tax=Marinobacter adhaerens TaxID=1033846 RepID=A0A844I1P3_9GAMM|nr:MBL fold metallo-hydrolase [Marinobacter adhaerens]